MGRSDSAVKRSSGQRRHHGQICITKEEACREAALGDRVQHKAGPSGGVWQEGSRKKALKKKKIIYKRFHTLQHWLYTFKFSDTVSKMANGKRQSFSFLAVVTECDRVWMTRSIFYHLLRANTYGRDPNNAVPNDKLNHPWMKTLNTKALYMHIQIYFT